MNITVSSPDIHTGRKLSVASVKTYAQRNERQDLARVCDGFSPSQSVDSVCRKLASDAFTAGAVAGNFAFGCLFTGAVGSLAGIAGANGAMMAMMGMGGVCLAGALVQTVKEHLFHRNRATLLEGAASTAQASVAPGSTPDTFVDRRYFQAGVIGEASTLRKQSTGEVLSKHVTLRPHSQPPVTIDENCTTGLLTIRGASGDRVIKGELAMPTEEGTGIALLNPETGESSWQTIAVDGRSALRYPFVSGAAEATLTPGKSQSPCWSNGTVVGTTSPYSSPILMAPFVTAQELGLPTGASGEVETHKERKWTHGFYVQEPEGLTPGQARRPHHLADYRQRDLGTWSLRENNDGTLIALAKGQTHQVPGTLFEDGDVLYSGEHEVKQRIQARGCHLAVETPQGRLVIDDGEAGLSARRYWADQPLDPVPVARSEQGYECEGLVIAPAIPSALLVPSEPTLHQG